MAEHIEHAIVRAGCELQTQADDVSEAQRRRSSVAHTKLTQSQLMTGNFLNIWNQFGCGSACLLLLPSATRVCHAAEMMQQHGARVDTIDVQMPVVFCFRWIHTDFRCLFNAPLRLIHSPLASQPKQKCQRNQSNIQFNKTPVFL